MSYPQAGLKWSILNVMLVMVILTMTTQLAIGAEKKISQGEALLNDAKVAMQLRDYNAAIKALGKVAGMAERKDSKIVDQAIYLKALAQYYNKQYDASVKTTDQLLKRHPQSTWRKKSIFLKAKSLIAQREYKAAEAIYEAQAKQLLSDKRKHEIAGVIIKFADALATKPDPDDIGAPPPNFGKAYNLYTKALSMEIGRDLRDQVMFKRANAISEAKNYGQAIRDFRAYLNEFDPNWMGAVGSTSRLANQKRENPKPAGQHILQARYLLIKSQLQANQFGLARVNAEDLISMIQSDKLKENLPPKSIKMLGNVHWQLVQSYRMPAPSSNEMEKAIKVTREFLEKYPSHVRSVQAAWYIPATYRRFGRSDQAIAEYEKCIAGKGYKLPAGDLATDKLPDLKKSPAELADEWKKVGLYRIGEIRYQQRKYDQAITIWKRYIQQHSNGPNWADCQRGIVNAQFQQAVDLVGEKKYEQARKKFDSFLTAYPLDGRARQVLFTFGQMEYSNAQKLEKDKADSKKINVAYQRAIDQWQRLVGKYPRTTESSLALYRIGVIYEEKLGDLDKALDSYRKLTWGSYATQARQRIAAMTQKQLTVTTERKFRTNEKVTVKVNARNIKKLKFKQYFLDLEAYFRKAHTIGSVDELDIDLIQPDKIWEVEIKDYQKYKPIEQQISVPFNANKPGVCVINISGDDLEATTLVIRSDLDMIVKSSRREILTFVQNMRQGKAAKDVKLLISDGKKVFATGKTGKDGVFVGKFDELKNLSMARVFAYADGHIASNMLNLSGLRFSNGLSAKGYIYTDRPAYLPGQSVKLRGIIRNVKEGSYVVPEGKKYTVIITDPSGRLLWQKDQTLSEFGSFNTSMQLNAGSPLGYYTITVRLAKKPVQTYSGRFLVQKFKTEKIKLTVKPDRKVYFRGEQVKLTMSARYYWGQPVIDKPIRYWLPDGTQGVKSTDAKGNIELTYDTTGLRPGTTMRFRASIEGENVAGSAVTSLAVNGFNVSIKAGQSIVIAGESVDVEIKTTTPTGDPVGKELTLYVLRRGILHVEPVLRGVPWMSVPRQPAGEVTVLERKVKTDPKTGKATLTLRDKAMEKGGQYILRVSGEDRFKQVVSTQTTVNVSDDEDAIKLRFFGSGIAKVGQESKLRLHARVESGLALFTVEGETLIKYYVGKISKGYNDVTVKIGHEHFPNFRVAVAVMDGRHLRNAVKVFNKVERELKVTIKPLADRYEPGATGQVELTVTDQLGKPVRGELSLALVDEALYAIYSDNTPNIRDYFEAGAHRFSEFRIVSTCGFKYVAKSRAVIAAYKQEEQRLGQAANEALSLTRARRSLSSVRGGARNGQPKPGLMPGGEMIPLPGGMMPGGEMMPGGIPGGIPRQANASRLYAGARVNAPASQMARKSLQEKRKADSQWGAMPGAEVQRDFAGGGMSLFDDSTRESMQVRKELPDAGYWNGSIVTDKQGKATVELPLPQTTTQWRLTARGCTVDTLVGQAKANVVTRKDFFVTLKAPRQATEGDVIRLLARVHNLTDYSGEVKLKLSMFGGDDLQSRLKQINATAKIDSKGTAQVLFDELEIPAAKAVKLRVEVVGGKHRDILEIDLPIRPWGLEFSATDGGVSKGDVSSIIELPKGKAYQSRWMTISVGPNLQRSVIDMALNHGIIRPYDSRFGCLPPPPIVGGTPGSELLAVISALQYAQAVEAPRTDIDRLNKRARSLISALVVSQRGDGGWSWIIPKQNSDWAATSMNFWALCRAKQAGLTIDANMLNKTQVWLKNTFSRVNQNDNDAKAVIIHALSCNDAAEYAHVNRLHRERNRLSSPALAYASLALVNLKRNELAGEMLNVLAKKITAKEKHISWAGSSSHPWLNDRVETTAIAALALMEAKPVSPQIKKAIDYLLAKRRPWGYLSAKAKGPAIAAISQYFAKGKYAQADYKIKLLVNGKLFHTITSKQTQGQLATLNVPADLLKDGSNKVEFKVAGRGEFAYNVMLRGFSNQMTVKRNNAVPRISKRYYRHARLEYRGKSIGASSTSPVKHIEVGQRVSVASYGSNYTRNHYVVVEEHLPAGMMLVEGSLSGNFIHHEQQGDMLLLHYRPNASIHSYRYELVGYASGKFRVLPTVVRQLMTPSNMNVSQVDTLVVLSPGEKSDDPYKMNDSERYELGRLHFNDGLYKKSLGYLSHLFKNNRRYNEKEVARMLLWIYTSEGYYDARRIVDVFEVLRERYPTLEIPFDKILQVGTAYRDMGEFERAYLVFKATIDTSFLNDANISAVLEDEGQFLASIDYQKELWLQYPDTAEVAGAYFAISQSLYQNAANAQALAKRQRQIAKQRGRDEPLRKPEKIAMLLETIQLLQEFMTHYPQSPLADDAAFSMANAFLDLKQYDRVVEHCGSFKKQFPKSQFASGFQYMMALGHFWQQHHSDALKAAKIVADGQSKDRDFATYIVGQIYHAENKPADAIQWYRKVAKKYADAKQAIAYFESRHIKLDEVNIIRPGKTVEIEIKNRNIKVAQIQVYKVDLMKLYLREKNLSNITSVNLAGIKPLVDETIELGSGKDYIDKDRKVKLRLKDEGAYLVICRGDDLFTSGLVLITPLKIEVQEDAVSGRVRANVIDTVKKQYLPEVHVKAIGSSDSRFKSGETDLRGVFIADNIRGKATVIARQGDGRYAFYRGEKWLGNQPNQRAVRIRPQKKMQQMDYNFNNSNDNQILQKSNTSGWDKMRRGKNSGVQIFKAK